MMSALTCVLCVCVCVVFFFFFFLGGGGGVLSFFLLFFFFSFVNEGLNWKPVLLS